jgi:hypothetical protein
MEAKQMTMDEARRVATFGQIWKIRASRRRLKKGGWPPAATIINSSGGRISGC